MKNELANLCVDNGRQKSAGKEILLRRAKILGSLAQAKEKMSRENKTMDKYLEVIFHMVSPLLLLLQNMEFEFDLVVESISDEGYQTRAKA